MEMPNVEELVIWDRLVQSHQAFALASMEFLTGNVNRVALVRYGLRTGHGRHTAIYMLRSLKQIELQELFDDLMFCVSHGHGAVDAIREVILSLPREWVLARIEAAAEPLLIDATYDEYRRLLELYELLDPVLTQKLAMRAMQHWDPDIREAGEDFLKQQR